ncbi:hypothetical protein [Lederbergia citrea]|uniref:Uncharacterized protein n=1 Tax=Lederbergia citrea TaxID=2833581 RepID=A0A942Z5D1_9BACI|nr:hypothetical protein [Lederbergia citrea]MBS4179263.1 hypothetical protein [Lederbergia citrea]MBS4205927.1 hypothetical protein [Lederbergia citrea]MBS4224624.1 hypothetical protein [Lederbergia citrea]
MDLWVTLCLVGVLGSIATFLAYFISTGLNFDDSHRVDKVPPNDFDQNM